MSGLKVAFIPSYVSGVVFYRFWQPYLAMQKMFKRDHYTVTWYEPDQFDMHRWEWWLEDTESRRLLCAQLDVACRWADVVVWMGLHTERSLDLFNGLRAKYGKPFVSEFDDYIFSIPRANRASACYKPGGDLTRIALAQMKLSDALVVSTPYLKELYQPINPRVHVVENAIDLSLWRRDSSPAPQRVTIGWMGGGTHNEDHGMIKDAVMEVLEKNPGVRFHYISGGPVPDFFKGVKGIQWDHEFKAIDKYPRWISRQKFNVGIAPLVDNNFNRCKSNLRWLEYSAMGIPTVASPVTHFKETIRDRETGFFAETRQEWVSALQALINEPELRENIGKAARQEMKEKWSPQVLGRKYRQVLEGIANAKPNQEFVSNVSRPLNRRSEQPEVYSLAGAG